MALFEPLGQKLPTTSCRYCGRPIVWAVDAKGTKHPLDAIAPAFRITGYDRATEEVRIERDDRAALSHWVTCAARDRVKADQIRRRIGTR